ncbi:ABC transporter substrate-binding protein [Roseibium sp.]|uniref:ABC transporter substrate-binding protein n=1 Tax=Roseibium sp. TaxID=1936156 RepID=UPI0032642343
MILTSFRTVLTAALLVLSAPGAQGQEMVALFGADAPAEVLVMRSTTDIAVFGPVVETYVSTRPGLQVRYEQWGSNELYRLSRRNCREGVAGADVVISSGVHQMVQLVNEACAWTYSSRLTERLPDALRWRDELWGITREPAVMVYNRDLVPDRDIPQTRFDLLDLLRPAGTPYAGRVATYDIEQSGLGYLFAFADAQEASTFGALQESFGRSGAVSTCCSVDIIRGVAEGKYLIAYNVLGSYAQGYQRGDSRIGIVLPSDYTLVLARALMIPKQGANTQAAAQFLDFLLSAEGTLALRNTLLISPLLETEEGNEGEALSATALRPIGLSPALMVALDALTRETFLRRWRATFPGP